MSRNFDCEELNKWISSDKPVQEDGRVELMVDEAHISKSTLSQIRRGRYVPAERTIALIRAVMGRYPAGRPLPARHSATG